MRLSFGTNRFDLLDPKKFIESCQRTEKVGVDHFWLPDSQLHTGDALVKSSRRI